MYARDQGYYNYVLNKELDPYRARAKACRDKVLEWNEAGYINPEVAAMFHILLDRVDELEGV